MSCSWRCPWVLGRSGATHPTTSPNPTPTTSIYPHPLLRRYICKALAGRLPEDSPARRRFIDPSALLLGARCSLLVAPLGSHGSLQDLVNAYLASGQVGDVWGG